MAGKLPWVVVTVIGVAVLLAIIATMKTDDHEDFVYQHNAQNTLKEQPMPPKSTMIQPEDPKIQQAPPVTEVVKAAADPAAAAQHQPESPAKPKAPARLVKKLTAQGCPHGLRFDTEMSFANHVPKHERFTVDMAAIREAQNPSNKESKIPRVIHQVQGLDQVPEGMREAMQTLSDANPEFEHMYFSDARAAEWVEQKMSEEKYRNAMNRLLPTTMRAQLHTLAYLWENGGIHLGAGFVAGKSALIHNIKPADELLLAADDNNRLSTEFIAASAKHPVIGKALEWAIDNVQNNKYGEGPESVTGSTLMGDAFKEVLKEDPKPGYSKTNIRVLRYDRKSECLIGSIVDGNTHWFWTRYPVYGKETRWYRLRSDDYAAAWEKRQVFGAEDCYMGLTLGQENDQINQAPARSRVLVDMSPYHPARKVVGPKQKIPRIILQSNKADRVPKDLRNAMQSHIDMNPEYEHYYFSDSRIRDFIKQHFDKKTLDAFDALIPGAYKSDLFRYCFLFIKGGVYIDGDTIANRPVEELLRADDEFVSAEDCGIGWVHNAFMASVPRHPLMAKAIEMSVDRITRRDYGENPLAITGPILLRDAFRDVVSHQIKVGEYPNNIRLVAYTRPGHCMIGKIEEHGRVVIWMRYETYKSEVRWYMAGKSYYHDMWMQRKVYH